MGKKTGAIKQDETAGGDITITVSAEVAARIQALYDNRHYQAQTMEDICDAIVRQGTKTLEKRRKETESGAIERAEAVLRKAGKL